VLAGIVVPLAARWAWFGWLARLGFVDAAGASVVHLSAGAFAAAGAMLVGPRTGKYNRDGSANMVPGHNVPLAAVGALLMLVAWPPYVAGGASLHGVASSTGGEAMNVMLAASAAGVASMALAHVRYGKPDVLLSLIGFMGGLVSITAAGGSVGTVSAVVVGAVAGVVVPLAAVNLDLVARLDDPTAAVAIHAVGGFWGTLAAGMFAPTTIADRFRLTAIQAVGALVIAALAGGIAVGLFAALKATSGLRVSEADEYDGLDLAEHDIAAYPDFQQTTIKSYHLREA
jgi:Amt family ammonium transporter